MAIFNALPNNLTNGTTADATQVMANFNKIVNDGNANAAPLSNTALLNANNNFSVVQSGVNATSSANFPTAGQVQNQVFNTLSSTLGTNTLTARIAQLTLGAYVSGQVFTFIPSQPNTGSATLNIDGLGSGVIQSNGQQLIGGELQAGIPAEVLVSASTPVFQLLSSQKMYVLGKSSAGVSCPADTNEDTLATITVPANALGANGYLRIKTWWTFTNSGNNKTLRVRFSGIAGTVYSSVVATTQLTAVVDSFISNRGATNSQVGNFSGITNSASILGVLSPMTTSSVDTTAATTLLITGQKASAGETLTLESFLVELMPG